MKSVIKRIPFDVEKAKSGAKIVTREGRFSVRILDYNIKDTRFPILALVEVDGKEKPYTFTTSGKFLYENEDALDLFIEEVEETDNYDPYKETVKSIADMVESYSELQSLEELKDFYNNVKIECREAIEYNTWCEKEVLEISPDKWYVCYSTTCSSEPEIGKRAWFYKGTSYLGTDILKLDLDFASENYGDYFHYWTIKDAKPGDVLHSTGLHNDCIFIFN